jgi:hypothetical protein
MVAALAEAAERPTVPAGLPVFRHHSIVLDYQNLKYNPCNDVIITNVGPRLNQKIALAIADVPAEK